MNKRELKDAWDNLFTEGQRKHIGLSLCVYGFERSGYEEILEYFDGYTDSEWRKGAFHDAIEKELAGN